MSICFSGTIFKNENTYWENIQSHSFRKGTFKAPLNWGMNNPTPFKKISLTWTVV